MHPNVVDSRDFNAVGAAIYSCYTPLQQTSLPMVAECGSVRQLSNPLRSVIAFSKYLP